MCRMRLLTFVFLLIAFPALAETFSGRVVSIHDGDTITVLAESRPLKVRLAEIDAPELRQPYGDRARESLADLCLDKPALVKVIDRNRQGGINGRVHCDGIDANAEQVHRGMAWVYKRHAESTSPLYYLEDRAQRSREGLWAEPSPAPPWRWRANRANRR